jgi:uncharacterized protein (DUF1778 family)
MCASAERKGVPVERSFAIFAIHDILLLHEPLTTESRQGSGGAVTPSNLGRTAGKRATKEIGRRRVTPLMSTQKWENFTLRFTKDDYELMSKVASLRHETLAALVRRAVMREIGQLGFLTEDERHALELDDDDKTSLGSRSSESPSKMRWSP